MARSDNKRKFRIGEAMGRVGRRFLNLLYPDDITCDLCGEELRADLRYRLCAECMDKLPMIDRGCLICGAPINGESDYCDRCKTGEAAYTVNRSPLEYAGEARNMIYSLKFGNKRYLAHTLAALMADKYLDCGMHGEIIVFVPMTEAEEKARGFNQSELLATDISDRLNIPMLPALKKVRTTDQQKKLGKKEREENLKGAFVCVFPQVEGRKILLIDDVFTTGATANECSKALIKAGAREVNVLTAAVTRQRIAVEGEDGISYI